MARRCRHVVALATVTIIASGCIGATDRADFNEEVRARGGGITTAWIDESLEAAAVSLDVADTADLEFMTLGITGTSRTLTISARRGDRPDFVDSVTVREGDVISVTPIQDADELPLADLLVELDEIALDQLATMVDAARTEFGESDAFVSTITVSLTDGAPTITMRLESARRTGTAVFDADGVLLEVET